MSISPDIKLLLKRMAILAVLVFIGDRFLGYGLKNLYFKQKNGAEARLTKILDSTVADIMVFGSSRAFHHYNPVVIQKGTGETFYNCGFDGQFLYFNSNLIKAVVHRHKPKTIIFELMMADFCYQQKSIDRLGAFYPYLDYHFELKEIPQMKGPFENLKLLSKIYPYNSNLLTLLFGIKENKKNADINGFIALEGSEDPTPQVFNPNKNVIQPNNIFIQSFESIISFCKKENIRLIVVVSPYYFKFTEKAKTLTMAEEMLKRGNTEFYDFSADTSFLNHPELFADEEHLNRKGAIEFSQKINSILNSKEVNKQ